MVYSPCTNILNHGPDYVDSRGENHYCGGVGGNYTLEDGTVGCKPVYYYNDLITYWLTPEEIEERLSEKGGNIMDYTSNEMIAIKKLWEMIIHLTEGIISYKETNMKEYLNRVQHMERDRDELLDIYAHLTAGKEQPVPFQIFATKG